jgi:hypothetical protein
MPVKRLLLVLVIAALAATAAMAAASYPSAVKSFTAKSTGDVIQVTHVTGIEDEVVAIEQGLLNGLQHALKPLVTGTYDLGTSSLRWRDLFLGRTLSIQGTLTADVKALDVSSTWNAGGTTFTAARVNVTDTASAAASLLLDLQVGGSSKWKVDKIGTVTQTGRLAINLGTITSAQALIEGSATWNSGSETFTAIFANITDTASAAGSALLDLLVGGTSQFKVTKAGTTTMLGHLGVGTASTNLSGVGRAVTVSAGTSGDVIAALDLQGSAASGDTSVGQIHFYHQSSLRARIDGVKVGSGGYFKFFLSDNGGTMRETLRLRKDDDIGTNETAMVVRYKTGTIMGDVVSVAAADSCGAGYRCLRVPNN